MSNDTGNRPGDIVDANKFRTNESESCGNNRNATNASKYIKRIIKSQPTPSERYYDLRLVSGDERKSFFGEVGDQCLMFHSNKICIVALAPSHPVIKFDKTITKIEHTFEGYVKIDRLSSKPKGKSKKGSQKLQKNSPICSITCSDDSTYVVTACIGSKLMEINQEVCSNYDLIKTKPLADGHIAIIQPNDWKRMDEIRLSLPKLGETL